MSGLVTLQREEYNHPLFSAPRGELRRVETMWGTAEGFVYFIAAGDNPEWVKIGFTSTDPRARLKTLQTGCPLKLRLIGAIPATSDAETEIHDVLKEERGIGEWFQFTAYVQRLIENQLNWEDCE